MTALADEAGLRGVYKLPKAGAVGKDMARIDGHFAHFISLSPFLCMGTSGLDGAGDVSPRGGEPGFVHVIDEKTLAMPDRPGNNRLDSLTNITGNPGVGLLFFIPGFEDTLRVNGFARLTTDPGLMQRFTQDGKLPRSVMLIEVAEAYLHCAKAIIRSGLWNPERHVDRNTFPTAGEIYRDQLKLEMEAATIDTALEKEAKDNLY
ncbi:MAG TPA: pyridoxamine 5'-phosphate oxidase family protein [Hyphomonadaceae bacterium]|jgi:PPOX class probable FMN-dependent enzyme|nr:pyridoxamine 5'-phosphate oxidase family protein [Hyphomonadaceae bacterium]